MSKQTELMAIVLVMMVVVFGIFVVTLASVQKDDLESPEVKKFEETGITTYFADEDDEEWEVVSRENNTAVVKGTIVTSIFVESLNVTKAERQGDSVVVNIKVNRIGDGDTVTLNSGEMTDSKMLTKSIRFPKIGYGYKFTIDNIEEDEEVVVRKVEDEDEEDEDDEEVEFLA